MTRHCSEYQGYDSLPMGAKLIIHPEIFARLPGIRVLVAAVRDIDIPTMDAKGCQELLNENWKCAQEAVAGYPNVQSHPLIAAWRRAYASLGISVKKYTSSIENLAKRASKPGSEPRCINPLVDFYNACSLRFLVPFGGFDLDEPSMALLEFRLTKEGDVFCALDATESETLAPGEAVYAVGSTVVTRHINWKQSKEGLITENTRNVVFMAEILADVPSETVEGIKAFLAANCKRVLNKDLDVAILDAEHPSIEY